MRIRSEHWDFSYSSNKLKYGTFENGGGITISCSIFYNYYKMSYDTIHGINLAIWPLMARVMTLLSSHDSANGPFFNYKGGEGKGGVQDSAIMFFGSAKLYSMYGMVLK